MKKVLYAVGLVLICVAFSSCSRQEPLTAEIIDYGIYSVQTTGQRRPAPNTAHGELRNIAGEIELIERTDRVFAHIGTWFGFRVSLKGRPVGSKETILFRIIHPPMKNPNKQTVQSESSFISVCPVEQSLRGVYNIEHKWEAVEGKWTMQVLSKNVLLAEKTFNVYSPSWDDVEQSPAGNRIKIAPDA